MAEAWDFIIVGGGSAGCVLANRLSKDPRNHVLLLEAGGDNKSFFVTMPKGFGRMLFNPKHVWHYPAEAHEGSGNGPAVWLAGKGLGGGSAVNGMLYTRGHPADYDAWTKKAGPEWSWAHMKRAFRAVERHELGDDGNRGGAGPVGITVNRMRDPLSEALIEAGVQMGVPRREDLNSEEHEGVGYYAQNIWKGRRVTAAMAFLDPVRNRPNLRIVTGAEVDRIGFDGRRAARVHAMIAGEPVTFESRGEIIVSCGTIGSPLVLQRSGVGPSALLAAHDIPVVQDAPVGRHLREHFTLVFVRALSGLKGHNHRLSGLGLVRSMANYLLFRRGIMANCVWDVGLFARSTPERAHPDIQFEVGGVAMGAPQMRNGKPRMAPLATPSLTVYGYLNQLTSEGTVEIRSRRPDAAPRLVPNFFATPEDRQNAIDMVRFVRRYFEQPALKGIVGEEIEPRGGNGDADILATIRAKGIAGLHATGTCAMGKEGNVVDARLRVRGVDGLRVTDCSVMPGLISGNTNGPAMALGWRAAELILEEVGILK